MGIKMVFKILGICMGSLVLLLAIGAGIYAYRCTHYWQDDHQKTIQAGFLEKQAVLPDGSVINYGEALGNGKALLLIHGQTGAWQDYERVLPELSKHWHVFAVDCYGHGKSSHNPAKYYLDANSQDLIWFIDNVIKSPTVVSGHSSGGLIAAYIAGHGCERVVGVVLEDPPVFSTEKEYFEKSFAYRDTYQVMHAYLASGKSESWEAFYLRHCLWGRLYMPKAMNGLANYAQQYHESRLGEPVQFFFMPESINSMFLYMPEYDFQFGDHFFDYSWHDGIDHATLLSEITIPAIFIHARDAYTADGILMAASSNEQARKAVVLMKNARLIELSSDHDIHRFHPKVFIDAINQFLTQ